MESEKNNSYHEESSFSKRLQVDRLKTMSVLGTSTDYPRIVYYLACIHLGDFSGYPFTSSKESGVWIFTIRFAGPEVDGLASCTI